MSRPHRYRCPDCRGTFLWEPALQLPDYCPLCGSFVGIDRSGDFTPKAPAIGKPHDSAEAVYRAMEASSIERAKMAAEITGVPESETAHMKMTDMKDNLRVGDVAAITRPNPTSTFMQQNPSAVSQAQIAGAQYAANTRSGPYPGAGNHAREMVGARHASLRAMVESQGKRG